MSSEMDPAEITIGSFERQFENESQRGNEIKCAVGTGGTSSGFFKNLTEFPHSL